ncbi:hypothetical protein B484DRAFT_482675 [Ochromonadaceae sp. CCMP2298]|nr:hypothetical protein B484DRAFT_482675 [Ochromonadaceae sp. CCMP2298]
MGAAAEAEREAERAAQKIERVQFAADNAQAAEAAAKAAEAAKALQLKTVAEKVLLQEQVEAANAKIATQAAEVAQILELQETLNQAIVKSAAVFVEVQGELEESQGEGDKLRTELGDANKQLAALQVASKEGAEVVKGAEWEDMVKGLQRAEAEVLDLAEKLQSEIKKLEVEKKKKTPAPAPVPATAAPVSVNVPATEGVLEQLQFATQSHKKEVLDLIGQIEALTLTQTQTQTEAPPVVVPPVKVEKVEEEVLKKKVVKKAVKAKKPLSPPTTPKEIRADDVLLYQSLKAYQLKALDKGELLEALQLVGAGGDAALTKKDLLAMLTDAIKVV